MLKSFQDLISFMESHTNLERSAGDHYTTRTYRLDRMKALLVHFGHPERSYRCLHVAGSKGKGSTSSYLACGLVALGYRTGLYMSPHLTDYHERWIVDGHFASDQELVRSGNRMKDGLESFHFQDDWGVSEPTTFELYTLLAFLLYQDLHCDYVVLETGLGGRLDATNTVDPLAAILCPIELEHTKILGSTIAQIATEKSKIIMPGRPVFVGLACEEAMDVFQKEAESQHSPLYSLKGSLHSLVTKTTPYGQETSLVWENGEEDHLVLSMLGAVQAHNAALALLTLRCLGLFDKGKTIPAFNSNHLPGRFELAGKEPAIYIDGAHTANSLKNLLETWNTLYPKSGGRVAIYGALLDKDHERMCALMESAFDHIIVSTPGTYKKSDIHAIWEIFRRVAPKKDILLIPDNQTALAKAKELAGKEGSILVTGSFYLGGAIKKLLCPV